MRSDSRVLNKSLGDFFLALLSRLLIFSLFFRDGGVSADKKHKNCKLRHSVSVLTRTHISVNGLRIYGVRP